MIKTNNQQPEFKYRGMMLDTCRHFFPKDAIKRTISLISQFGGNIFHWHLTDDQAWRFSVPGYEKCITVASKRVNNDYKGTLYEGYYTDEEIKEIVDYSITCGVTIIPEIETPGHSTAIIAAYPELGCTGKQIEVETSYGVFNDVLNPASPAVYTFLDAAIKKLATFFPGDFIHIGGDECPHTQWEESEEIQALMKKEKLKDTDELQGWITTKVANLVVKYNKRPIAWDEALESPNIPQSLVIMNWRQTELAIEAARRGHEVIMCPYKNSYLDYSCYKSNLECGNLSVATVKDFYSIPLYPEGLKEEERKFILGGQANLWTEKVENMRQAEYLMFPRLIAYFEALTNYSKRDWEEFKSHKREILHELIDSNITCYPGEWE